MLQQLDITSHTHCQFQFGYTEWAQVQFDPDTPGPARRERVKEL